MTGTKKSQSISIAILAILTAAALFFAAWVSAVGVPSAGAAAKGTTACFNTAKGTVFLRTLCKTGERKVVLGVPGATGAEGAVGPSAFDLAQVGGFSGTVADWLGSLVGLVGLSGVAGTNGLAGVAGPAGLPGADGLSGAIGDQGAVGAAGAPGPKGDVGSAGLPGFIPAYGSFYDTTTQINTTVNEKNVFTYGSSSLGNAGVSVENESHIVFANSGTYNIQFSAQLFTNTKATAEQVDIWLSKNGVSESFSNTQVQVPSIGDKTGKAVAAWNFMLTVEKGDYCELLWLSDQPSMSIASVAAEQTPAQVAIPSIILTVVQVG